MLFLPPNQLNEPSLVIILTSNIIDERTPAFCAGGDQSVRSSGGGYDDGSEAVHISTEPSTESVGMFSWFPLFIPLRTPVLVPEGGRVEAAFWRNASRHRVWYEWALTEPQPSPIHNPNGRSYHIGL